LTKKIIVRHSGWVTLPVIKDGFDGVLSVAEALKTVPFDIKRVYYIYNLIHHKDVIRGKHAHKTLHQILFCINGNCKVSLDDGVKRQIVELKEPNEGIYLGPGLWHTMYDFRNSCILLVFSSDHFNESDYIRNYSEFLDFSHTQQ
jgi:dTDP-4-dehydrorhamnose 3,5-epimerase-like enzyme